MCLGCTSGGRKVLGAKINADPGAESSAGWWMEETGKHTPQGGGEEWTVSH